VKEKRDEFEVGKQQAMTDTYQEQVEKLGEARRKAAELLNEDLNEVTECFLVVLCVCVCGVFFFFFFVLLAISAHIHVLAGCSWSRISQRGHPREGSC
jgi:hypothetical protein